MINLNRHQRYSLIILCCLILLPLSACGGEPAEDGDPEVATEAAEPDVTTESQASPTAEPPTHTPTPTPRPTETPTPLPAGIDADLYYLLEEDGTLQIEAVSIPEDGWIAVYPSTQSAITTDLAIGYLALDAGMSENIEIEIDLESVRGRSIQLALHGQRGADAEFMPSNDNLLLIETVNVDTPQTLPLIEASDQKITAGDGMLRLDRVQAQSPGWVLITQEGEPLSQESLLGYAPISEGESFEIPIPFRWHEANTTVDIHLWTDEGVPNQFEWEVDEVVAIDDEPVITSVDIELPFEIIVYDQPAVDSIYIERIITDEPGLIVVYTDVFEDDQVDIAIGYGYVEAGITEGLVIDVNENAVTQRLLITQNKDVDGDQELDFPIPDEIRLIENQVRVFPLRTDQGDFIVVSDQIPTNGTVQLPLVSVSVPSWIVIYAANEDDPTQMGSEILGSTFLEPGFNTDVSVNVGLNQDAQTVYAMLHVDNIEEEIFEPDRNDWPTEHEGREIIIGFEILAE